MPDGTLRVIQEIEHERRRQVQEEDWTPHHDDSEHEEDTLARAAACYAIGELLPSEERFSHYEPRASQVRKVRVMKRIPQLWPWEVKWWKPKDRRRDLVRAGALIVAEIERIDRQKERSERAAPEAISNGSAGATLQTQE